MTNDASHDPQAPDGTRADHEAWRLWFDESARAAAADLWSVYDAHYDAVAAETERVAQGYPEFAALLRATPAEQRQRDGEENRARLRAAFAGDWPGYERHLRAQGAAFARLEVSFHAWYDVVRAFQRVLLPRLVERFVGEPARLTGALTAMQDFVDYGMALLSQAFLDARAERIAAQRELAEQRARALAESEQALRRQSTTLEAVLHAMRDGVAVCDEAGRYLIANPAMQRVMDGDATTDAGFRAQVAPGTFHADGHTPFAVDELPMMRALRGETCDNLEMVLRRPHLPDPVFLLVDGRPLRAADGALFGALVTFRDVTSRRESEERLRRSEEQVRLLLESTWEAIYGVDPAGALTFCNPACARALGCDDADALLGQPLHAVVRHAHGASSEACDGASCPFAAAYRDGAAVHADDVRVFRGDGSSFPSEWWARPKKRGDVTAGGVVAFVDISERRHHEEVRRRSSELEAQNARIREASRLKSEFLANMSHELRTPLNAIIGFSELLHDEQVGPLEPQQKEFLGDILTSGRHLLQLINDVLDLAKVESGKLEFHPEPVTPSALIGEVRAILRATAAARGIHLEANVDEALDAAGVRLDPARFKQVLYNYVSNALKFTPHGGRVVVRARPETARTFRVEVEDTGVGIAPEDIPRLFVEFQQLDAGAAKEHGGTGLGLALTRRIVEAQGGSVGVRSARGRGSVFHAVLPRVAQGAPLAPGRDAGARAREPHTAAGLRAPRAPDAAPVVLVVEDDARDRAVLVRVLSEAGYEVETATTGAAALRRCRERAFDAITLDLLLPDMTGLDVLASVRTSGPNASAPVIVVSVVAEQGAVAGFRVHDILPKPLDAAALLASLARAGVPQSAGARVLVVDDDPAALRVIQTTLAGLGYAAACCQDAAVALAAATADPPALVVLDLLMPEMDGFEFLQRLRRSAACRDTPVVVWTAKELSRDERALLGASARAVVAKGGREGTTVLLEQVATALRRSPGAGGG